MNTKNNNIDLAISFDSTGSMYPCLTQVRREISLLVKDLFKMTDGLRIAIIAHGDYCDAGSTYVTKILDFTDDVTKICDFINRVERTHGGDAPECYELVLNQSRSLSWQAGKSKVLVMIGDDIPHGPNHFENTKRLDWRNELKLLLESNINVYGVHALAGCRQHAKPFYEEIARTTGGFYLTLDQFSYINDLIRAIAVKQQGDESLASFADQLQKSGRMTRNVGTAIGTMLGKNSTFSTKWSSCVPNVIRSDALVSVPSGRFQVMSVDSESVIMNFVTDQGITFKKGRGFYQLTKSEKVQGGKEIILQDKETGEFFNGPQVRKILGLSEGIEGRLSSKSFLDKFEIFVQSTSLNRKLVGGTKFLYEIEDWER